MQRVKYILLSAGLAFALAGCESSALQADYGQSVRLMTDNQVYDRHAQVSPSSAPVTGADPDMLNNAVTTMRTEATDRKEVKRPVLISIGGQGGQ